MSVRNLLFATVALQCATAFAIDHNAYHAHEHDTLGWDDTSYSPILGGQTTYTPDLDFETRFGRMAGKVLDEISLTITFNAGETPDINKVVRVAYGAELSITPSDDIKWRVVGQNLHLWYGFHEDRSEHDRSSPKMLTDSDWVLRLV